MPIWLYAWPSFGAVMSTHLSFWQNVPSPQGVAERAQGALMPPHSLAEHEDISDEGSMGPTNPSEQNPLEHFKPIGHCLFARQGSLAVEPPLPCNELDEFIRRTCRTTNAPKTTMIKMPSPVPSLSAAMTSTVETVN